MPISYQFLKDDEPVSLTKIDEEMCELLGEWCDPERYCFLMLFCQLNGTAMLMKSDPITKASFDAWLVEHPGVFRTDREIAAARHFLYEHYIFNAWYGR